MAHALGGQRNRADDPAGMPCAIPRLDAFHRHDLVSIVDRVGTERAGEGARVNQGAGASSPNAGEVHVAGYDHLRIGPPLRSSCGRPGAEGRPGVQHGPRLAGWKNFGADAAQQMPRVALFWIALASESDAGHSHDTDSILKRFVSECRVSGADLIDAVDEFITHAAPRHEVVEKGIAVTGPDAPIGRAGFVIG